ncbi:MAG: HIT domain-containing protein [Bacteroidetes bacterium]|nr:HIT domain-containing protein [Bacteroidota bacterium]
MASLFTKIITGEIPSYKIAENDYCFAFLDIFPLQLGHTLVVPKMEVDKLFDLPKKNYDALFSFCHSISKSIEKSFVCNRVSMHVIGLEVPHAHVHLIPITTLNDCNFTKEKLKLSEAELKHSAEKIKLNL